MYQFKWTTGALAKKMNTLLMGQRLKLLLWVSILETALRGAIKTPSLRKTRRGKSDNKTSLAVVSCGVWL